jgi:putative ABC transport system ATP-binding protein
MATPEMARPDTSADGGAPGPAAVELHDVVVQYASGDYVVRPIDGLSLAVPAGSIVLLLGPSGCGKTTLLSCLGGILSPTSGRIRVAGAEVSNLSGRALDRYRLHSVGFVFQSFNLVASLDIVENVMVPLRAAGRSRADSRARAVELLEQLGLGDRLRHRPNNLSGGQQQRVAIARALALDPPLVLADEPTAHLDYIQVEGVLRVLRGVADDGRVVVVSTHDDRMLPLADVIVEMQPRFLDQRERAPETIDLAPGATLFRQGDAADLVYVIDEGELIVERRQPDGAVVVLARRGAGDHIGEMGPLFGLPRSATVRTDSGARLTAYTAAAFRELVGEENLATVIAGRD